MLSSLELGDTAMKVGYLSCLQAEADMMDSVSHAHILPAHAVLTDSQEPDKAYMVMRRAGPDLQTLLLRGRCAPLPCICLHTLLPLCAVVCQSVSHSLMLASPCRMPSSLCLCAVRSALQRQLAWLVIRPVQQQQQCPKALICKCRPTMPEVVVRARQVVSAMAWLHSKQLVHSDLHSKNVLQSLDGLEWLIADFGNADWMFVSGGTTRTNLLVSK